MEEQLRVRLDAIQAQMLIRAKVEDLMVVSQRLKDSRGGHKRSLVDSGIRVRDPVEWEKVLNVGFSCFLIVDKSLFSHLLHRRF